MPDSNVEISKKIRQLALEHGFTECGFAPAGPLIEDAVLLKEWLSEGMHAGMRYMEKYFEKRTDPSLLVPGAKSVIIVLLNYFPVVKLKEEDNFAISKYAYGKDYHKVMKSMLKRLLQRISEEIVPLKGRIFIDSAPVLERSLAAIAGLGWIGKNANLISPKKGSFLFIGELIVNVELEYGRPMPDHCGECTKCIASCPTGAIVAPGVIDSRRCISYWTIEHKGSIDTSLKGKFDNRIFGCDICQDVCPWNRKVQSTAIEDFHPKPDLVAMTKQDWEGLTREKFDQLFSGSAAKRTGYEGLVRNIRFVSGNEELKS